MAAEGIRPGRAPRPQDQRAASRGGAQSAHELLMRLLAPFSVRQKLLAVVLLTTLTALLVAIAVMVGFDLRTYRQSLISDMTTQADLLGRTTAPALTFDDPRVAQENLELLRYRPQIRAAAIYNARGKIFEIGRASCREREEISVRACATNKQMDE